MKRPPKVIGIACSVFRKEIEYLVATGKLSTTFTFVDSELHMQPQKLNQVLDELIRPNCLLCYGDCHSQMSSQESSGLINRTNGLNCVEIFLGKEMYHRLRKEGVFFLLPEWTIKWERIFKEQLGFKDQLLAAQFMTEMHTKFIYVNTGVQDIPAKILDEISGYFSLPVEIINIELINIENAIKDGLKRV